MWSMRYIGPSCTKFEDIPEPLKPFCSETTSLGHFEISGLGHPPANVIDCISKTLARRQYLELKVDNEDSYVWPTYTQSDGKPIRCNSDLAIMHFHCDL